MRENQTSNFYKREGSKKELFLIFIGNGQEFHEPGPLAELSLSLSLSHARGGGGTWVFSGWVCAARDSKLATRSRKNFP